jgi:hypothetical protein
MQVRAIKGVAQDQKSERTGGHCFADSAWDVATIGADGVSTDNSNGPVPIVPLGGKLSRA